ncbi:hypothetical protein SFA35_00785 [Pseudomonas sp. HR96]|uniref:hypothetical protein n=1 Tax=Pseudomonas sp. HR96 TaxID=1027966 RepID=UPI002A750242|nr:hypothetical protein [Pseudomonas sp. HR96]WPO99964.1 hypothetical protein SFA35_00785 [Pseudomonas sp. HR96]
MRSTRTLHRAGLYRQADDSASHLTLNLAHLQLGLGNLLDLQSHEIQQHDGRRIHRLTFISGETLSIETDGRTIDVSGRHINFEGSDHPPFQTWLIDPAR